MGLPQVQWVIDAVTCFIRDHALHDHTSHYERLAALDQLAARTQPDAWQALTKGSAILRRPLIDILWKGGDFEAHKAALLDIMVFA